MRYTNTLFRADGFSLVEILIAFVILVILAGLSAPNFSRQIPKRKLHGATQQVVWDLRAARTLAIRQQRNVKVVFANGAFDYDYKIWHDADSDNVEDAGEVTQKTIRDAYHGVHISSAKHPIFTPTGAAIDTPTDADPITLSNGVGSKTIVISLAGHVSLN